MKIPVPKQHGAWGMLYVPFLIAVFCSGGFKFRAVLVFLILTAGFFLQECLLALIRLYPVRKSNKDRFSYFKNWTLVYSIVSAVLITWMMVVVQWPILLFFGLCAAAIFIVQVHAISKKSNRKIFAEMLAVFGLTMSAPFTWAVLTGKMDVDGFLIWILNALYFGSSIFYVKTRVASVSKKDSNVRFHSVVYHCFVAGLILFAALFHLLPFVVVVGFLPVLIRAFWGILATHPKPNLRRIGFAEIAFSIFFLLILTYGLR